MKNNFSSIKSTERPQHIDHHKYFDIQMLYSGINFLHIIFSYSLCLLQVSTVKIISSTMFSLVKVIFIRAPCIGVFLRKDELHPNEHFSITNHYTFLKYLCTNTVIWKGINKYYFFPFFPPWLKCLRCLCSLNENRDQ